jgi:spore maturation protein A
MNRVFFVIVGLSLAFLLFTSPETAIDSMVNGSQKGVNLCIILVAVYDVWLSLLELVSATKLDKKLAKLIKPISRKLFGKQDSYTESQIAINISSNMLGVGNASTPSGIRAMQGLDKKTGKITKAMAMLVIINTTAIQLIPSTIIGLRASYNSVNATNIVLPTLIATSVTTIIGILSVIIVEKIKTKLSKRK